MSNLQLPHDNNANKDRITPREIAEQDKARLEQERSEENLPEDQRGWVPPGNKNQGSRKD